MQGETDTDLQDSKRGRHAWRTRACRGWYRHRRRTRGLPDRSQGPLAPAALVDVSAGDPRVRAHQALGARLQRQAPLLQLGRCEVDVRQVQGTEVSTDWRFLHTDLLPYARDRPRGRHAHQELDRGWRRGR